MTFFSTCETAVKLKGSVRVIDGGFMVHKIVWHRQEIFSQILDKHVEYVQKNYSSNTSVVFDGYPEDSAASKEHQNSGTLSEIKIIIISRNYF